jgi:peptidoglycan-associated lipoprotein
MIKNSLKFAGLAVGVALLVGGCSSSGKTKNTEGNLGPPPASTSGGISTAGDGTDMSGNGNQLGGNGADISQHSIYFDYNESEIKAQYQQVITNWAKYLAAHPTVKVQLQGNADERGTREFNVALAEQRADAVSSSMASQGASAQQISVISYGKERPVCSEHEESCWQQNRRVDIVQQ